MLFETKNIVKQYSGHLALNNVSINIPHGSIYGLLGPNGAGKTTFIRIINSILKPDSGEIKFKGKTFKPEDVQNIGYLPEERGLYKKMKVGEQVLYLARLKGLSKREAQNRMKYWFEKFELQLWQNRAVEELSKGMQQKVQFVSTVLHEPELLIFDEPFSGFDPLNANLLKQEILELRKKGSTIIFSTHNMLSVEELCDEISLINNAKVVLEGNVNTIKERYKQNIFVLRTDDNANLLSNVFFEVISMENKAGRKEIRIKNTADLPVNDLISNVMQQCSLLSFEEELPNMDEIFIQTVNR